MFYSLCWQKQKIIKNSPGAKAKISSVEKRMNNQIKFIFFLQILLGLLASIFSLSQIISLGKELPYIYKDKNYIKIKVI